MLAKLWEQGATPEQRREIAVTKDEFLMGRGPDCDLRLQVPSVSRHHCLLRIRAGEATLSDLGSANGTYVNDVRIRSQTDVINRDVIGVGDFRFVLELEGGSGIIWGPQADSADGMPTCRLPPMDKKLNQINSEDEDDRR